MLALTRAPLRRLAGTALDLLLPPRCLSCGTGVSAAGTLCAACWRSITFLGEPCCQCCGVPFEFEIGPEARCGACARLPPAYARARAAMRYDEASRKLVLAFKHGDLSLIHI